MIYPPLQSNSKFISTGFPVFNSFSFSYVL
jgi:hypothetical protein